MTRAASTSSLASTTSTRPGIGTRLKTGAAPAFGNFDVVARGTGPLRHPGHRRRLYAVARRPRGGHDPVHQDPAPFAAEGADQDAQRRLGVPHCAHACGTPVKKASRLAFARSLQLGLPTIPARRNDGQSVAARVGSPQGPRPWKSPPPLPLPSFKRSISLANERSKLRSSSSRRSENQRIMHRLQSNGRLFNRGAVYERRRSSRVARSASPSRSSDTMTGICFTRN